MCVCTRALEVWQLLAMAQVSEAEQKGSTHMHSKPEDKPLLLCAQLPALARQTPCILSLSLSFSLSLSLVFSKFKPPLLLSLASSLTCMDWDGYSLFHMHMQTELFLSPFFRVNTRKYRDMPIVLTSYIAS